MLPLSVAKRNDVPVSVLLVNPVPFQNLPVEFRFMLTLTARLVVPVAKVAVPAMGAPLVQALSSGKTRRPQGM